MTHIPHQHRRADDPTVEPPPAPMTEDQLNWIEDQVYHAADKTLSKYSRRALVGFALLFAGFLYVADANHKQSEKIEREGQESAKAIIDSGTVVAVDGCNRAYEERVLIRDVFLTSKRIVEARIRNGESLSPSADAQAVKFYKQQLKAFRLPDCRKAADLLTSDKDKTPPQVEAFWRGNPNAPRSVFSPRPPRTGGNGG